MFLLDRFQEFYAEMSRLRPQSADYAPMMSAPAEAPLPPRAVWEKLKDLLQRQAAGALREGGDYGADIYGRAQYAMAALADEIFIRDHQWSGAEDWSRKLLETELFGTHRAGEQLFERIEDLLRQRDAVQTELARVYLAVLALGFQGKFRNQPEAERDLERYRRRLHQFIFGREPKTIVGRDQVTPQAYAATLDERRPTQLPRWRVWAWAMAAVILAWLVIGHVIWRQAVNELEPTVKQIIHEDTVAKADTGGTS